jgi:hypothetical protein
MMAVAVRTRPDFSAGKPAVLFEGQSYLHSRRLLRHYDVSPGGREFLMIDHATPGQRITQLNVVLNWFEELRRRVPTQRVTKIASE